jgi:hypothetical protein
VVSLAWEYPHREANSYGHLPSQQFPVVLKSLLARFSTEVSYLRLDELILEFNKKLHVPGH